MPKSSMPDVAERNAKQRLWRKTTGSAVTKRYEKTARGLLMRTYRNMKSRVEGVQHKKAHLYAGKEILPKAEFYAWALSDSAFAALLKSWENSNYDRRLSPSIDRIDPTAGYTLGNMRWLTHSDNSRRAASYPGGRVKLDRPPTERHREGS